MRGGYATTLVTDEGTAAYLSGKRHGFDPDGEMQYSEENFRYAERGLQLKRIR